MTYVCLTCLRQPYLRTSLAAENQPCDYCDAATGTVSLFEVAQACDAVLDGYFEPTHFDARVVVYGRSPAGHGLEETLQQLGVVSEAVLPDLIESLQDLWFDHSSHEHKYGTEEDWYDEPWFRLRSDLDARVNSDWSNMEASLRRESRYVNPKAMRVLDEVFGGIHTDLSQSGRGVIVTAGPRSEIQALFRARVFQTEPPLVEALAHPARLLGTPAEGYSAAGRMNAKGQPAFYGSTTLDVALREVRPPVGSIVATAAFEFIRDVRLLDLRALSEINQQVSENLFDPTSLQRAQRRAFLRTLGDKLTQPVMPELQDRDYLITQVIADYLANHEAGELDGIIFPSVQRESVGDADGVNVVLFSRASLVAGAADKPIGHVQLWEYEDDGPGRWLDPMVWERNAPADADELPHHWPPDDQTRPSLAFRSGSLQIHRITGVEVHRDTHQVHQHRLPPRVEPGRR